MTEATLQSEKHEFKTELKQLLHIITHSLYSNKEIFLRELISNASDAINKIKFNSLQHEELLEDNKDWKIKISANRDAGTLTISDNGIGMSRDDVIENLGTIAKSGTRAFLESLKQTNATQQPELIGQFGVGFYSAFMVADKVTVITRPAGDPSRGVRWESDGQGEFTVESIDKPARGTDVILHLKKDEREFLEMWKLRSIVKKFSDFLEHPVVMDVEREDEQKNKTLVEETLNSRKAIWLRGKAEVTQDEYTRVLQADQQRSRAAGLRDPLHRRGQQRVSRAAVHSRAPAPGISMGRRQGRPKALHPARADHGPLRGAAAALPAFRARRRR